MISIKLIKCRRNCFDDKTFKFFAKQKTNKFIVSYRYKYSKTIWYGLLETFVNGSGHTMCTLSGEILYQLGDRCTITGYCPIEIIKQ